MSQFCKTRKKARKNMNIGEVIFLTCKYDHPARQPKKTVMATPLFPWWMPYAWHIQSQQLALHVDMWLLHHSKEYPAEALMWTLSSDGCRDCYDHAWLVQLVCHTEQYVTGVVMLFFRDICFLLLLNHKATTIECLPDTLAIPSSSLLKILNRYLTMFSLVTIPSATTGITAETPGRKGKKSCWWRWQRRWRERVIETKQEWTDGHSLDGECQRCGMFPCWYVRDLRKLKNCHSFYWISKSQNLPTYY